MHEGLINWLGAYNFEGTHTAVTGGRGSQDEGIIGMSETAIGDLEEEQDDTALLATSVGADWYSLESCLLYYYKRLSH